MFEINLILMLDKENTRNYKMYFFNYVFIKGKKAIQTYLTLFENIIAP